MGMNDEAASNRSGADRPALERAEGSYVLTVNGGSSSLKFAVFARGDSPAAGGFRPDRTGRTSGRTARRGRRLGRAAGRPTRRCPEPGRGRRPADRLGRADLRARVGRRSRAPGRARGATPRPEKVTDGLLDDLRKVSPFDPDHIPGEFALIEAFRRLDPDLPQVACFDTAFHHDLPRVARIVPIPRRIRGRGRPPLRVPRAVLRVPDGRAVPSRRDRRGAGPRGPRAGLGVGGEPGGGPRRPVRGDDHGLHPDLWSGHGDTPRRPRPRARLVPVPGRGTDTRAIPPYGQPRVGPARRLGDQPRPPRPARPRGRRRPCGRGGRAVLLPGPDRDRGAAAALGGLDTLVFAGGIGENSPEVRRRVLSLLGFLGVSVDPARNQAASDHLGRRRPGHGPGHPYRRGVDDRAGHRFGDRMASGKPES